MNGKWIYYTRDGKIEEIRIYNKGKIIQLSGGGVAGPLPRISGYGVSKAGNDVVRVYQVGGDTKTIQPGWKLFRVDRIKNLKKLGGTFDEAKPLFNPTGDKDMIKIYNITQFD